MPKITSLCWLKFPVELTAGEHTLTIAAVDDHIVLDQWMLDFKADRKYYVIPQ